MSDELVIRFCAPTLASLKTGSLFACLNETEWELKRDVLSLNRRLHGAGLRVLPLKRRDGRWLVYVYRPRLLARDLGDRQAQAILDALGYPCPDACGCVRLLGERLRAQAEFPHEIGLFLGYPPEDVEGFMARKGGAKCVGCWKVYGDAERSQRLFARYARCTSACLAWYAQGMGIEQLAVRS